MDNIICPECGTENESEYLYCKNCGVALNNRPQQGEKSAVNLETESQVNSGFETDFQNNASHNAQDNADFGGTSFSGQSSNGSFNGVPYDDVVTFVGSKAYKLMPKFVKMEVSRSKVSWCWPAAILGFLFGPLGSALWFFYRKMYKLAFIFVAVGAAVVLTTTAMNYNSNSDVYGDFFASLMQGDYSAFSSLTEEIDSQTTILSTLAQGIEDLADLAACIISGIFGLYFYKEHCIKSINNFKAFNCDERYYRMGLSAVGGVSGGMLAVGILIIMAVSSISGLIVSLLSIL